MTLSSPTRAKARFSIVQPSRAFKTSRASSGPRHDGVCFHQRWPLVRPRHSASSAKRETNGSGSPRFIASAAARSWSITLEVLRWQMRTRRDEDERPLGGTKRAASDFGPSTRLGVAAGTERSARVW
jgi:hypothetical protein